MAKKVSDMSAGAIGSDKNGEEKLIAQLNVQTCRRFISKNEFRALDLKSFLVKLTKTDQKNLKFRMLIIVVEIRLGLHTINSKIQL